MNVNLKATLIWAAVMAAFGSIGWFLYWVISGNHFIAIAIMLGVSFSVWMWGMIRIGIE